MPRAKATYGSVYGFGKIPQTYVKQAVDLLMKDKTKQEVAAWTPLDRELFGIEVRYKANSLEQLAIFQNSIPYLLVAFLWSKLKPLATRIWRSLKSRLRGSTE